MGEGSKAAAVVVVTDVLPFQNTFQNGEWSVSEMFPIIAVTRDASSPSIHRVHWMQWCQVTRCHLETLRS